MLVCVALVCVVPVCVVPVCVVLVVVWEVPTVALVCELAALPSAVSVAPAVVEDALVCAPL